MLLSEKGCACKHSIDPIDVYASAGVAVAYVAVIAEPADVVAVSTVVVAVPTVEPGAVAAVAATNIAETAADELEIAAATAQQIA